MAQQHRQGEIGQLVGLQPEPEGMASSLRWAEKKPPTITVKPSRAVVMARQEGQVVVEQEAVGSTATATLNLRGQVARAIGAEQAILDGLHQRAGVDDLLGVDPGQRVAGDVAGVVMAGIGGW